MIRYVFILTLRFEPRFKHRNTVEDAEIKPVGANMIESTSPTTSPGGLIKENNLEMQESTAKHKKN